jgi:amino acid transporter
MNPHRLHQALLGTDRDVSDQRVFKRMTVGVLAAWIALGGDLLGSCVYGPDVLARSSAGQRSVFLVASVATLGTLGVLAWAYMRMIVQFPHGGGGYTAAKHVIGQRPTLVSGIALVLDTSFNVAVSVATCVHAASDLLPETWRWARLPAAVALILILTFVNLRGVKDSIALLVPIVLAFVLSHVLVLGFAIADRAGAFPSVVASVPADLGHVAREKGSLGLFASLVRAYALGGAIYTGIESVSNGVTILREPKVRSARRTMMLVVGIPALIITSILASFLVYEVHPESDKTMNALLFERIAARLGGGTSWEQLLVTVPLLSEALLLVMAAQTGFVDGPRILGALATDRFLPRRLSRLNARLAPGPGILVVASMALTATLVTRASIEPLISVFVLSVFITFTVSQWAMLLHAVRRRGRSPWRLDAGLHAFALLLCLAIFAGSVVNWWKGAMVTLTLITTGVTLAITVRHRYEAMERALGRIRAEDRPPEIPPEEQPPVVSTDRLIHRHEPVAIIVLGERTDFARVALRWLSPTRSGVAGVILAHVSLIDAESVHGEDRLRELEAERRAKLEQVAEEVRRAGFPVAIEMRRGADVLETTTSLVVDLMRDRPAPSMVIGFRSHLDASPVDPLLRDDLAIRLQARLEHEKIAMAVVSVPLDA